MTVTVPVPASREAAGGRDYVTATATAAVCPPGSIYSRGSALGR